MPTVLRIGSQSKSQTALPFPEDLDARIALIQVLIPLGLQAVEDVLQALAGRVMRGRTARHTWCAGGASRARSTSRIRNCRFRCPGCVTGRRARGAPEELHPVALVEFHVRVVEPP